LLDRFGIEGIYIVHAKTGYELHENRINTLFPQIGLKYEFVTDGDPSSFSDEILNKYFTPDIKKNLSAGVLSCTLNHILAYERIVHLQNKYALVFENDPFFLGDFCEKIKQIAREADTLDAGFIISLENTTLRFPPFSQTKKGRHLYEASFGRAAGAYLIDLKAARNILLHLQKNKCGQVIDWWHNTLITERVIRIYWAHPPLTEQGSHNGLLCSTISTKNKSLVRRFRWITQKYFKMYVARWFK
jgi:glycosyl transferase family 25